jgi:hypothetical protein
MSRSSQHRPGGMVLKSPSNQLKLKLEEAATLDRQLAAFSSPSSFKQQQKDEVKAAQIRPQLCEVWSDIIILSPAVAVEQDCIGRLWRR